MGASTFDTTRILIGIAISQTFYTLIVQVQGDIPRMVHGISASQFNETVKPGFEFANAPPAIPPVQGLFLSYVSRCSVVDVLRTNSLILVRRSGRLFGDKAIRLRC